MNEIIRSATDCNEEEVDGIEDIMRHDIFQSTLDWQTREELEGAFPFLMEGVEDE